MRRMICAVAISLVFAIVATAQRPKRAQDYGLGTGNLLNPICQSETLRRDLKLTAMQLETVHKLAAKHDALWRPYRVDVAQAEGDPKKRKLKASPAGLSDFNEELYATFGELLTKEQKQRLLQIERQVRGPAGIYSADDIKELALTAEQVRESFKLASNYSKAKLELRKSNPESGKASAREKQVYQERLDELKKSAHEDSQANLTKQQQAKWKELLGEPIDLIKVFGEVASWNKPIAPAPREKP